MEISLKADFKQVIKKLKRIERKQIPFAAMLALNDTAFQSRKVAVKAMPRFIDRPTPVTLRGLLVGRAKKAQLASKVFFKPFVWRYMRFQVVGGTRSSSRKIAVPGREVKLNKYGNIPGRRRGLLTGGAYFADMGGGRTGIFKPKGKKGKRVLRAILVDSAAYKPRYPFHTIIERAARKRFKPNFERSLTRALRTAR